MSPWPEVEEQRCQQEEQEAKKARSKALEKARYEKRKAEKREFTARKKARFLTLKELETEEKRLTHNRERQKEWREKRKAAQHKWWRKKRAYASEASKKSRQKMYEKTATGNSKAVERYENDLAARKKAYHRKKQRNSNLCIDSLAA